MPQWHVVGETDLPQRGHLVLQGSRLETGCGSCLEAVEAARLRVGP